MTSPRSRTPEPEPLVLPPPDVPMRTAGEDELGRGPKGLIKALTPNWTWRATYARGPVVARRNVDHKRVETVVQADSLAVRLRRTDGLRAVAVWLDSKAEGAWTWPECTDPDCPSGQVDHPAALPTPVGITALRKIVTEPIGA